MHSRVSFDGHDTGEQMVRAALDLGLKEICFTDHMDYDPSGVMQNITFDTEVYNREYDALAAEGLKIRRGMEFGLLPDNQEQLKIDLQRRPFDFVLGSIHFADGMDVYFEEYWHGKTQEQAMTRYLEQTLECVKKHDDFDVLAHLTYLAKTRGNPDPRPIREHEYRELTDEILRVLAQKGKGLECNTSGMNRCGDYLPGADYFRRFKELGGEIVTVGSDAHTASRVGQYSYAACDMLKDIFGYVCTFENRNPIFHKL